MLPEHDVLKLLKDLPRFEVGAGLNAKVLQGLKNKRDEREFSKPISHFNFLTFLFMSPKKFAAVIVALALLVTGTSYYQINTYGYHLEKAQKALAELKTVLEGKNPSLSFIPMAFAQEIAEEVLVNETEVAVLTETVVTETEAAIDIAEEVSAPVEVQIALQEIAAVQEESLTVLAEAAEVVSQPETVATVVVAIETTASEQAEVTEALQTVETAVAEGQTTVEVSVETTADAKAALEADGKGGETDSKEDVGTEEPGKKAQVCHKNEKTLSVGWPAVRAHLAHGDTLGTCGTKEETVAGQTLKALKEESLKTVRKESRPAFTKGRAETVPPASEKKLEKKAEKAESKNEKQVEKPVKAEKPPKKEEVKKEAPKQESVKKEVQKETPKNEAKKEQPAPEKKPENKEALKTPAKPDKPEKAAEEDETGGGNGNGGGGNGNGGKKR